MRVPGAGSRRSPGAPEGGDGLRRARSLLKGCEQVVVLTGAGVSAESGVPTFRGADGLWRNHRPEELATPSSFRRDPRMVWEWYQWRRDRVARCRPNPGHQALAEYQRRTRAALVTQNVDGLHGLALEEAGVPPAEAIPLVELHGSLFRVKCTECSWKAPRRDAVDASSTASLPRCPECTALARPDVVWFGESLAGEVLERALRLCSEADACLVVGTSAVVQPAASLPLATRRRGGMLIEVNPERTPLSGQAAISLRGPAGAILPRLLEG